MNRWTGRFSVLLGVLALFPPAVALPQGSTPATRSSPAASPNLQVAQRYVDAINSGNQQALRALFATDATVTDTGRTFRGLEQIMGWARTENFGVNGRITVLNRRTTPDGAALDIRFASSGYNGSGTYTFMVRNGRIQSLRM